MKKENPFMVGDLTTYSWTYLKGITYSVFDNFNNKKLHEFVLRKDKKDRVYVLDKIDGKKWKDLNGRKYKVYDNAILKEEE